MESDSNILLGGNCELLLILSEPGTGKTSLAVAICEQIYNGQYYELIDSCNEMLEELNEGSEEPFELVTEPPIYQSLDLNIRFQVDYEEWYEPYIINPYYMGMTNGDVDVQYLLPCSVVFIPEFQKYTNSRKGQSLKEWFYRTFEIYRHWRLKFVMDGHKGSFIDLRVRALTKHIIEVQKQVHEYDEMGRITKTTWYCREFFSLKDYDAYIEHNEPTYKETTYEHEWDIFEDYNSFSCAQEFVPPKGKKFSTLKPLSYNDVKKLPPEIAKYYNPAEPAGFRGKPPEPPKEKKEKADKKTKKEEEGKESAGTAAK